MIAIDTLVTKMILDTGDFTNNSSKALGVLAGLTGAIVGLAAAGATAGVALMRQAADFDSLRQSLVSIEGDAKKAGKALADLKVLAKAPGLGFEEAVRGYTGLRNAGLTQQFAERLIREFANANARGGGNADTFGRILTQIKQAAIKPYLSQEDLRPIGEAGIPINSLLKQLFGTGDTEALKAQGITSDQALHALVDELAKLPRVAGGARNEFDNLADAVSYAAVSAGDALNNSLLPYVSKIAVAVGELTDSGVIETAFQGIADNVTTMLGLAADDASSALIPLVAGLETISAGFRNLTLNVQGLAEILQKLQKLTPWGAAMDTFRGKKDGDVSDGLDLASEYERTVDTLTAQLNGFRKRKPKPADLAADQPDTAAPPDQVVPLLKRVAIATEKQLSLNQQVLGGGSLVNNAVSKQSVGGITGSGSASQLLRAAADALDDNLDRIRDSAYARFRTQGM